MSGQLIFFDIPSRDGTCWSLNTWKTRLALNFKGVDYKTEWLEYPDIAGRLQAAGLEGDPDQIRPFTCPAVQFPDGTYIMNSKKIIARLEADYPEPPLYHDAELSEEALKHIAPVWGALGPLMIPVVPREVLNERSAEYFWRTRKEHLGMSLDEFEEKNGGEKAWEKAKKPIEDATALLNKTEGPFFLGDKVSYADFLYVGAIAMAKRLNEENYRRIVEISDAFDKQYKACGPWLERNDH
ncbi:glutathione s-transferase [Colletotrichum kahawae]|uniref:Glutathione s-transferase n=1 Tax=Colletotrichum kahawae TaxID=34407 RepID=A0AAD9XVK0_COLKA|nr:glutathione s-transferase [Colletotrichum kahawae]